MKLLWIPMNSQRERWNSSWDLPLHPVLSLHPVTPKPPESPYGAKYFFLAENPVSWIFGLLDPYRTRLLALVSGLGLAWPLGPEVPYGCGTPSSGACWRVPRGEEPIQKSPDSWFLYGFFMVFSKNWISKNWTSIDIHCWTPSMNINGFPSMNIDGFPVLWNPVLWKNHEKTMKKP